MTDAPTVVFGGTGFLGRRLVRRLLDRRRPVRVAVRRPARARELFGGAAGLELVEADLQRPEQVTAALRGAGGAINAVSLYVETEKTSFHDIHVAAAGRLARLAREARVESLVQLSGIGADPRSPSAYIASRGAGEAAVRQGFPEATLVRPAVMVGEGDSLVVPLAGLLRRTPVFPLFGRGATELQPAWVEDVAAAILRAAEAPVELLELGGADRLSYRELIEAICRTLGRRPLLLPLPFAAWRALATTAERLPEPPVTRNQVELMQIDNTPDDKAPGFRDLGLVPRGVTALLPEILRPHAS